MDYTDLVDIGIEQYFDNNIVLPEIDEVFVDGGSFDGCTILEFIKWTNNKYKHVYAYEPIKENCEKINKKINNIDNVTVINKALWNKKEVLYFDMNGAGSAVNMKGETIVNAEILDKDISPTFIKLDIEGAEMNALHGIEDLIVEKKPKLAICIYHLYDDLWKIPLYIHKLVPEYKLYIRHYSAICEETVLYAVL